MYADAVWNILILLAALLAGLLLMFYQRLSSKKAGGDAASFAVIGAADGPAAGPAESPAAAPADSGLPDGALRLTNVDDATAAMLMAIVSEESGIPPERIRFRSIRQVGALPGKRPATSRRGTGG